MKRVFILVPLLSVGILFFSGCEKIQERRARRLTSKAVRYIKSGNYSSAQRILREALNLNPNDFHARYYLGRVLEEMRMYPEALRQYRLAATINPDDYRPYFSIGSIYFSDKKYLKAAKFFREAIKRKPDHLYSVYHFAMALHRLQKFEKAEKFYRKAIAINPKFLEAYNGLATLLYDWANEEKLQRGEAAALPIFKRAEQVIRSAIEKEIADARSYNILGLIYQKQNRFEEAIRAFEKAKNKLPLAAYNLGITYDLWYDELTHQAKSESDPVKKKELEKEASTKRDLAIEAFKDYLSMSVSDPGLREQVKMKVRNLIMMKEKELYGDKEKKKRKWRRRRRRR